MSFSDLEVLWEGEIHLDKVFWSYDRQKKFQFSESFQKLCQENWKTMIKQYPDLYDGTLLVLDSYKSDNGDLHLQLKNMRFSELSYHVENQIELPESLGSFVFQTFVVNRERTHFLIGARSKNSEYMPGFITIPGEMFEEEDADKSIMDACMRELDEEIDIILDKSSFTARALMLEKNNIGSILLTEVNVAKSTDMNDNRKISGNEEWEGNELKWYAFEDILLLDDNEIMEGLMYLKNRI